MDDITNLITSIGFPCAMCICLLYYLQQCNNTHKEEMDGMKDALNENSKVLETLKQLLEDFLKGGTTNVK